MLSRCAGVLQRSTAPTIRSLSSVSLSLEETDPDYIVFPRERAGLSYDLNWSLADDGVTPSGDAYRNASLSELLMFAKGSLSASKAIDCGGAAASEVAALATDELPGLTAFGLDDYDEAFEGVTGSLTGAERLFVEDAAFGCTREAEVRVRVISDSPEYALVMRNLLARTPLYHPEAFPRPIVVYIASNASGPAFTALDFDPEAAKASLLVSGQASVAHVREQIGFAAGLLASNGGYRHVRGGGPRVQLARDEGNIDWYVEDRHKVASADDAHPDLLRVRASAVVSGDKSVSLVVDGAPNAGSFAAHDVMWTESGISRAWDGVMTAAAHSDDLPKGSVTFQGTTTSPLTSAAFAAPHPTSIAFSGSASDLPAALGLDDTQAEKLEARLKAHNVKVTKA